MNLDESSNYFKFVIVSDKPKPSKNNFTEKPSKDKDNMTTKSSTSNNNSESSMDEKKPKETDKQTVPEVKVNDTSDTNGDSAEEQKNEENISSRSVQNSLSIKVPSKSASPQLVTSPSEIKATSESSIPPTSPRSSKSGFKNFGKKLGNIIRNSSDNNAQTTSSDTIPEQGDAATSDSVQSQQEQVVNDADNATPESIPEGLADSTENTANAAINNDEIQKKDDDKKGTPQIAATKQRTNSLSKFANVKMFITRTSSVLVEKLEEKFDELDKRIYPDIDVAENDANNRSAINEREQLLENKDVSPVSPKVEITNGQQKAQSTKDILADVGVALNERQEKLDDLGEKSEKLSNNSSNFAEMAAQLRRQQEQKNKSWKFW